MGIFGLVWKGLMFGCFVTFVVVASTLVQARKKSPGETGTHAGAIWAWVITSIVGFGVWAFVIAALLGFGFSHSGNLGVGGILANILLFGGPALYIYAGYQHLKAVNTRRQGSSAGPD